MANQNPIELPDAAEPFVVKLGENLRQAIPALSASGIHLMVALSGGPDSCALLAACAALRKKLCFNLSACHINHGIRGAEADGDEEFCEKLCSKLNVPFKAIRLQTEKTAEAHLRELRYDALQQNALEVGAGGILTGHTLDDQVETLLFRLFRGSGPLGLTGIEVVRKLDERVSLVRPMLNFRRSEIVEFVDRLHIEARSDSTNRSDEYARNYIRSKLVPLIDDRFPGFQERVEQFRNLLAADEELLNNLVEEELAEAGIDVSSLRWDLDAFQYLAEAVKRRAIAISLRQKLVEVSFERTMAILAIAREKRGAVSLNEVWDVRVESGFLTWMNKSANQSSVIGSLEVAQELRVPGMNISPMLGYAVRIDVFDGERNIAFPPASAHEALVDLSRIEKPLVLRRRRPGDVICPLGMNVSVKLKKYLHTHKTDLPDWDSKCLVIADDKEVVWVPGVGLSEKIKVHRSPTHKLTLMRLGHDEVTLS